MKRFKADMHRMQSLIDEFASIGANEKGGIDRSSFSEADIAARGKLFSLLQDKGLEPEVDPVGNIFAKRKGAKDDSPAILIGSHIDSVANGGKYDGILGLIVALEIVDMLDENGIITEHPLKIVSFTGEEPNTYRISTLGSRAFAGKLKFADLAEVVSTDDEPLRDGVDRVNGCLEKLKDQKTDYSKYLCFIELHIEQGSRLDNAGIPVGVVTRIVGIYRDRVRVKGQANHAGTTLMEERKDALMAAADILQEIEGVCRAVNITGTVGQLTVLPNEVNIVPGEVDFIMELRAATKEQIYRARNEIYRRMEEIKTDRNIETEILSILDQDPVKMDSGLIRQLENTCLEQKTGYLLLESLAGHDACHMAGVMKAGMVFVPSRYGMSHCPQEYTDIKDIVAATEVLFHSILSLDKRIEV